MDSSRPRALGRSPLGSGCRAPDVAGCGGLPDVAGGSEDIMAGEEFRVRHTVAQCGGDGGIQFATGQAGWTISAG